MAANVFNGDLFSEIALTETIMTAPVVPGGLSQYFYKKTTNQKSVYVDRKAGKIILFNEYPRGGTEGNHMPSKTRDAVLLRVPHIPVFDELQADDVQGVRKFGSETELSGVEEVLSEKALDMGNMVELNLESHRLGAIQGVVKNGDGTTILDMFDRFNVTRTTFNIELSGDLSLKSQFMNLRRTVQKKLGGGYPLQDVVLVVGFDTFSYIVQMAEVEDAYNDFQNRQMLRENQAIEGVFKYCGVTLKLYDWDGEAGFPSAIDDTGSTVADMEGHAFPVVAGTGLFREVYGPGDMFSAVNTMGQKMYLQRTPNEWDNAIKLKAQTNPLIYCTRPEVLIKVDFVRNTSPYSA